MNCTIILTEAQRRALLKYLATAELKAREIPEFTAIYNLVKTARPETAPRQPEPANTNPL
jgi:hypothetical protein